MSTFVWRPAFKSSSMMSLMKSPVFVGAGADDVTNESPLSAAFIRVNYFNSTSFPEKPSWLIVAGDFRREWSQYCHSSVMSLSHRCNVARLESSHRNSERACSMRFEESVCKIEAKLYAGCLPGCYCSTVMCQ